MKRTRALALALLACAAIVAYVNLTHASQAPLVTEVAATRGDLVESVSATGTLAALRTVDVGTQVSGKVQRLNVDFNSIVTKGEIIAEIDPSPDQAQLASAGATLDRARIDLAQEQTVLESDQINLDRTEALLARELAAVQDVDAARLQVKVDDAQIDQDRAEIATAEAGVQQARVNLDHCTITSPIDGVVISRDVDEGQTVAASASAPTLYVLATDLTSLQVLGDIDEADVGRVRAGQSVTFTVDAYPSDRFHGIVNAVRLDSTTVNNVVTYQTVITTPNPDLRLRPGMTANLTIEISRALAVLRVPNAAVQFRPSREIFAAFRQPAESVAPPAGTRGQVWVLGDHGLAAVAVRLGITDGTWTQVLDGDIQAGENLVSAVILPSAPRGSSAAGGNPLLPQPARGRAR